MVRRHSGFFRYIRNGLPTIDSKLILFSLRVCSLAQQLVLSSVDIFRIGVGKRIELLLHHLLYLEELLVQMLDKLSFLTDKLVLLQLSNTILAIRLNRGQV